MAKGTTSEVIQRRLMIQTSSRSINPVLLRSYSRNATERKNFLRCQTEKKHMADEKRDMVILVQMIKEVNIASGFMQ